MAEETVLNTDLEKEDIEEEKAEHLKPEQTSDEQKKDIQEGNKDADTTSEQGREELSENDEISPAEEAFAEGAEDKGELGTCAHCGKPLDQDKSNVVEREINNEKVWFCCDECANKGKKAE
ncbi:hypothetical protein KY304_02505 [Candidatus Woesearchaeota archaeon]|nr:hypothetical protein [Candidatus Woesearchaeota archaeon]MBW2978959.1 hypothetical protein [Candidatus Woesearchaeota archaeon]